MKAICHLRHHPTATQSPHSSRGSRNLWPCHHCGRSTNRECNKHFIADPCQPTHPAGVVELADAHEPLPNNIQHQYDFTTVCRLQYHNHYDYISLPITISPQTSRGSWNLRMYLGLVSGAACLRGCVNYLLGSLPQHACMFERECYCTYFACKHVGVGVGWLPPGKARALSRPQQERPAVKRTHRGQGYLKRSTTMTCRKYRRSQEAAAPTKKSGAMPYHMICEG